MIFLSNLPVLIISNVFIDSKSWLIIILTVFSTTLSAQILHIFISFFYKTNNYNNKLLVFVNKLSQNSQNMWQERKSHRGKYHLQRKKANHNTWMPMPDKSFTTPTQLTFFRLVLFRYFCSLYSFPSSLGTLSKDSCRIPSRDSKAR
jgi:hypothetical protein